MSFKTKAHSVRAAMTGAAMLLALPGTPALAADYPVLAAPPPPPSAWQFQAIGYGWATAINGEVGASTGGRLRTPRPARRRSRAQERQLASLPAR